MKVLLFVCLTLIAVGYAARPQLNIKQLYKNKRCLEGPKYTCTNLTTAAECRSVKHCIQTVWEHQIAPPDTTSICQRCKDVVKEARDNLLSNGTEELIKETFEGSCDLVYVKEIVKVCRKIVDEAVPELVDTLASQMDPTMVCTVAGLCNNQHLNKLVHEYEAKNSLSNNQDMIPCYKCQKVFGILEDRLRVMTPDEVLQSILRVCGKMGSLSDSCSNIVLNYFTEIYSFLKNDFNAKEACYLNGECTAVFHNHNSNVIAVAPRGSFVMNGDEECDFCKQMVLHLKDILVANTTEATFKRMLLGICGQFKQFQSECTSLVEQYYSEIYQFLSQDLNGTMVCSVIGICPGPDMSESAPIAPLLRIDTIQKMEVPINQVSVNSPGATVKVIQTPERMQLPIERLIPQTLTVIGNTKLCTFCEYFLHYVQQEITDPHNEEEVKRVVEHACEKLPGAVTSDCKNFVDVYGNALVALLAEDLDPSVICPRLSLCPAEEVRNVEVFIHKNNGDKPNCPLCLFAITELEQMIKNNKTEENIKRSLENLCSHLKNNLKEECDDFVETYTKQIMEAVMIHMTPQEVCEYLKICKDENPPKPLAVVKYGGEIETNEIPDYTVNGVRISAKPVGVSEECKLCQFISVELAKLLNNSQNQEDIKEALDEVCNYLGQYEQQCVEFVNTYYDTFMEVIILDLDADELCPALGVCPSFSGKTASQNVQPANFVRVTGKPVGVSEECKLCEFMSVELAKLLNNPQDQEDIKEALDEVCNYLGQYEQQCVEFVNTYSDAIIEIIIEGLEENELCPALGVCPSFSGKTASQNVQPANFVRVTGKPVGVSEECKLCQYISVELAKLLNNSQDQEDIKEALDKVCDYLGEYEQMCVQFVNTYSDAIIETIMEGLEDDKLCPALGVCPSSSAQPTSHNVGLASLSSPQCALCKLLMEKIETLLQNITSEAQFIKAMHDVCDAFPGNMRKDCNNFTDKYGHDIFRFIKLAVSPSDVCSLMLLCSVEEQFNKMKNEVNRCGACKSTIESISHIVSNPHMSLQSSSYVFEKVCRGLATVHRKTCKEIVHTHGKAIRNKLSLYEDENNVCEQLGYCAPTPITHRVRKRATELVGANKCTWGPGYWCDKEENARGCGAGAVKFCQEKVWLNGQAPK